jgi:hypothetical protein
VCPDTWSSVYCFIRANRARLNMYSVKRFWKRYCHRNVDLECVFVWCILVMYISWVTDMWSSIDPSVQLLSIQLYCKNCNNKNIYHQNKWQAYRVWWNKFGLVSSKWPTSQTA